MPANDFKQLSSRDFEELTRDLLQAEWGVALEAFKTGRDQGIDLRRITAEQGTLIVQCKHFATSGYAKLLAHLRSTDLEKVRRLNPGRYVLVTSVALSPHNKDAVQELLAPFIRSPNDVIGANDIDSLLQRHPDVARANFKLWLTSTEILERVLHNAVKCQTEFEIERVIRKLPIFVQNAAYPRAQEILNATSVLVISGVPGIGKTTLAEILLYAHLEQGYEPVVIQTDVREGKDVFKPKRRQVFYFDDFLGQTFLGEGRFPGSLNSDVALVEFVEMVRATGQSRFILTTREHLLQGARTASERLSYSALIDARCVLELADYSKGQRARILYNHLYFSDLAREYKEEMIRDDFFLEVVGHKHFSPRLIEWLSASRRLRNVQSVEYQRHVRNILANPHAIWSHAFNHQISAGARNLLLALYSLGPSTELVELEPAWKALNSLTAQKYNRPAGPKDYSNALKELDNAFATYRGGRADFLNPSVREMVAAEVCATPEFVLDVVASASRFQQITSLLELAEQGNATIQRVLSENGAILEASMLRLLRTPAWRWDRQPDGRSRGSHIDVEFEQRLVQIGKAASFLNLPSLRTMFETEVRALPAKYVTSGGCSMRNARSLIEGFDRYPQLKGGEGAALQRELLDTILNRVDISYADQINVLIECSEKVAIWSTADGAKLEELIAEYRSQGCDEEFDNCQDSLDYGSLRGDLDALGKKTGKPFTNKLQEIDERLAELEPPDDGRTGGGSWKNADAPVGDSRADTDDAIREVFGALLE
jgi:Novel STAND NTPase 3/Restriction endonuclease